MKVYNALFIFVFVWLITLCACDQTPFVAPGKTKIVFSSSGGTDTIGINANFRIEIMDCPEWVTVEGREINPEIWAIDLFVKVPENTTCREREGFIVLGADSLIDKRNGNIVEASATIKVTQLADSNQIDKESSIQTSSVCPTCNGTRRVKCTRCRGQGYCNDLYDGSVYECSKCGGSGFKKCPNCENKRLGPDNTESPVGGIKRAQAELLSAESRMLGKNKLSLNWISWKYFGSVEIKKEADGTYTCRGEQLAVNCKDADPECKANGDYLKLDGTIKIVDRYHLIFNGEIRTKVFHINNGQEVLREGTFHFDVTNNRNYWRMQEMTNPADECVDYIDIYFNK